MESGKRLGHFELLAPLGAGGMGEVHQPRDTDLRRDVALKILPEEVSADPRAPSCVRPAHRGRSEDGD